MPRLRLRTRYNPISRRDQNDSIKISVDNRVLDIVCSKTELRANSEYFNVMLSRYHKEDDGIIVLKEIDRNTMQELLRLVQRRSHPVRCSELPNIIILSDMLLFDSLKNKLICEAYQSLSKNNCLKMWMKLEILSLIPLVWKAKSLSLTTFAHQRDTGTINNLELSELLTYLRHPNLQCGSEINVFHCIIEWIEENRKNEFQDSLKETLGCINYKDTSLSELSQMKSHPYISKHNNIVNILQYISRMKCGEEIKVSSSNVKIAQAWYSNRGRNLPEYLFVFYDDFSHDFFFHGHHADRFFRKIASVSSKSFDGLTGGEIQAYNMKVYVFGGEFSMGKGPFNDKFWEFDLETKQLINTKYGIPKRRHFKSCIVGDNLFIMGGTGAHRVKLNDMHWFSFTTKKWNDKPITLPCCATSFKYCNFNGQLFILDCPNKHGYIFLHDKSWKSLTISDSVQELVKDFSSLAIFAYRGNLFFKGGKLLELELIDDILTLKSACDVPHPAGDILIETAISNNRVYTMYADQPFSDIKLHCLDLDNLESVFLEKVGLHYDSYTENDNFRLGEIKDEIDEESLLTLKHHPNKMMKMFCLFNYKYCDFEDLFGGDV